jgi:hypothetical protein
MVGDVTEFAFIQGVDYRVVLVGVQHNGLPWPWALRADIRKEFLDVLGNRGVLVLAWENIDVLLREQKRSFPVRRLTCRGTQGNSLHGPGVDVRP